MNQYVSILLHITCNPCNIELGITQYYSLSHGHNNITQYYMQYWVVFNSTILNITYNITQYYMSNYTIFLNIT